ncbi:MAG: ATP-binding protein, partial [Ramlibacter sp.]
APVLQLKAAAADLGRDRVPPVLHSGVAELDQVGAALHLAGVRFQQTERVLEARVTQAVQAAEQAQAKLFEARKHEAIGRLTGGVAHDFNNLLQTISMGLQVVQRTLPEGSHSRPLAAALSACGKAADLVRQMLAFGRPHALQPRPVLLDNMLLHSRELTAKAAGERIRLVADVAPGTPPVLADPTQLELALLNLVFNARDAMPQGGTISIRASGLQPGDEGVAGERPLVRIEVVDDGAGMDPATLSRVFEPYFTTKTAGAGTGLGLPQVQAFARLSGGDVRIDSSPGQGTRVSLYLPAAAPSADVAPGRTGPAPRPARQLHILMAEDDLLVASVVPAALEREGHRVTLCRSADDARALLAAGAGFDVLFTDVVMPGAMTGLDLVAWCREHRPGLPALVATGYSVEQPDARVRVVRKPYAIEELLAALEAATLVEPAPLPA